MGTSNYNLPMINGTDSVKIPRDINNLAVEVDSALKAIKTESLAFKRNNSGVYYLAHRGASNIAPENTMPAFEYAGELGFWGIETDVWRTADGVWMCMHDETVDRMTNGTGKVEALTLEYIKSLTIDSGSNVSLYESLRVPTLEECFAVCKKYNCAPVVEIKGLNAKDLLYEVIALAKKHGVYENLQLTFGDQITATALRQLDEQIVIHQLAGTSQAAITFIKELKNAVACLLFSNITPEVVTAYHNEGILISTYGMFTMGQVLDLVKMNVDFIIADNHGGHIK